MSLTSMLRPALLHAVVCAITVSSVAPAFAKDDHAAIQSTRGVQHKAPMISDDFVVACIMIMFLMLFAFGARDAAETRLAVQFAAILSRISSPAPPPASLTEWELYCVAHRQAMIHTVLQAVLWENMDIWQRLDVFPARYSPSARITYEIAQGL